MQLKKTILIAITALCGGMILFGIVKWSNRAYTSNIDKNATPIARDYVDEQENINESEDGQSSAIVICAQNITVHTKTENIDLFYQNPHNSQSTVILELYAEDSLIASSEEIPSGYELDKMNLSCNLEAEEGNYEGKLKTIFVDELTHEKADIDSEVDVLISIKND